MCRALDVEMVRDLARKTVSCDGFPLRVKGKTHCGLCTSCLLRRTALHAAGLGDVDRGCGYLHDLTAPVHELSSRQLYPLYAMLGQVETIGSTAGSSGDVWQKLTEAFPELYERQLPLARHYGLSAREVAERIIRMYTSYVKEWWSSPVSQAMVRGGS